MANQQPAAVILSKCKGNKIRKLCESLCCLPGSFRDGKNRSDGFLGAQ